MATSHPCRKDRHKYQTIAGAIAGLGRRSCSVCGSVQIDMRAEGGTEEPGTSVFFSRRPTLFSLRLDAEREESVALSAGFGTKKRR